MTTRLLRSALMLAAFTVGVLMSQPASAQQTPAGHQQVLSANPFGLLLEFFNAEYERIVTESSTAGVGGSTFSSDDERYVNADVFWRFYPQGNPLDGWAFGAKVGLTSVSDHGSFFGFGFDVNRSWLLGANDNFYVGIGFGLKRLLGASDEAFDLRFIPTIRLANIGFAF
jgi:hypothetical protein